MLGHEICTKDIVTPRQVWVGGNDFPGDVGILAEEVISPRFVRVGVHNIPSDVGIPAE